MLNDVVGSCREKVDVGFRFLSQIHVYFSLCKPVLSRSANLADHYARRHCANQRGVFANETPNVTLVFRADGNHQRRNNDPERRLRLIQFLHYSVNVSLILDSSGRAYLTYGEEREILKSRGNKFRYSNKTILLLRGSRLIS